MQSLSVRKRSRALLFLLFIFLVIFTFELSLGAETREIAVKTNATFVNASRLNDLLVSYQSSVGFPNFQNPMDSASFAAPAELKRVRVSSDIRDDDPARKIGPQVRNDMSDGKRASVVIFLEEQADLSSAYGIKDQDLRGWFVYNTLRQHAERTQAGLRTFLEAEGVKYQSFWAANMLVAEVDRSLAERLAERPDVARVDSNRSARWIEDPVIQNFSFAPESPEAIEWGLTNVNAPAVWGLGFTGQGMVVGDLDTGMRWTHAALKPKYRGWNGTVADHNFNWHDAIHSGGGSCGANTVAPCDDHGHGTHTAGTTVGDDGSGNQIGVAPGARWIGCRNMDQGNGTPATYTECFQFMIAPTDLAGNDANPALRPHVLNNSWGCPASEGCVSRAELETIINNTQAAGIFVEVSAGNSGPSCSSVSEPPAIYLSSFSTGAIDISNGLANFSSRGPSTFYNPNILKPNISAPGVNVRSSYVTSDTTFANLSGTSMAGPHVAGVVALLWSARPQLVRDIAATKTILQNTANPNVTVASQTCGGTPSTQIPNNSFGYGRVDALAAVNASQSSAPTIVSAVGISRQQGSTAGNSQIAAVTDDGGNGGVVVTVTSPNPSNGVTISNIINSGGNVTADIVASCGASNAVFTLLASDGSLTATANLSINVTANAAPTLSYGSASIANSGSTSVNPVTGPSDNGSVASVVVQSAGTYAGTISVNAAGVVSISNAAPIGSHTITIRATDNCGTTTDAAFTLDVTNHVPGITAGAAVARQRGTAATVSMIATVSDLDQSAGSLVVTATTVPSGISVNGIANAGGNVTANILADCGAILGANTVVLTVTDSNNGTATANFTVNVSANTAPSLAYLNPQDLIFGGSVNITPTVASDNGTVTFAIQPGHGLATAPTVNLSGVVSVTNAQPAGLHTITIRATDNCGAITDAMIPLNVVPAPVSISGNIKQSPANTSLQGVTVTLTGSSSQTTSTDSNGNYSFSNLPGGGSFTIAPSGFGETYDPISRSFSNLTSNVTIADFLGYLGGVPRVISIGNSFAIPGALAIVPVNLTSQGTETTISFSLIYNSNLLSLPVVTCGSSDPGCSITSSFATGAIGIAVTPASQLATGQRNIVNVSFQTFINEPSNTAITFGTSPTGQLITDSGLNPLPAAYNSPGFIIFGNGVESDVAGRPNGSGSVDSSDVVGVSRIVAGLDTPGDQNTNEFQRGDCAPAGTKGDGVINSSDIVQTSRYNAGLDGGNQILSGGPFQTLPIPTPLPRSLKSDVSADVIASRRTLRMVSIAASQGSEVTVSVEMNSLGDEIAAGFSVHFDPSKLKISDISSPGVNPDVKLGTDAAVGTGITVNATRANDGEIRIVMFNANLMPFAGLSKASQLFTLTFDVAANSSVGPTPVTFGDAADEPSRRSMSDGNANTLKAAYLDGFVTIVRSKSTGASTSGSLFTPSGKNDRTDAHLMKGSLTLAQLFYACEFGDYPRDRFWIGQTCFCGNSNEFESLNEL